MWLMRGIYHPPVLFTPPCAESGRRRYRHWRARSRPGRRDSADGRGLRRDVVAGDKPPGYGAIEAGELRRVASADNAPPAPPADLDLAPLADATVAGRYRRHAAAIAGMPHRENLAAGLVEPGAAGKTARRTRVIGGTFAGHHARVQPLLLGDPQRRIPALG